jgi:hypothetical protein
MVMKLVEPMIKFDLAMDLAEAAQKLDHWSNVILDDYKKQPCTQC